MYKHLNEPDAVKGLIMKVFAKSENVRYALDIFENKRFISACEKFDEVLQFEKSSEQISYIKHQKKEAQAILGKWDDLIEDFANDNNGDLPPVNKVKENDLKLLFKGFLNKHKLWETLAIYIERELKKT